MINTLDSRMVGRQIDGQIASTGAAEPVPPTLHIDYSPWSAHMIYVPSLYPFPFVEYKYSKTGKQCNQSGKRSITAINKIRPDMCISTGCPNIHSWEGGGGLVPSNNHALQQNSKGVTTPSSSSLSEVPTGVAPGPGTPFLSDPVRAAYLDFDHTYNKNSYLIGQIIYFSQNFNIYNYVNIFKLLIKKNYKKKYPFLPQTAKYMSRKFVFH